MSDETMTELEQARLRITELEGQLAESQAREKAARDAGYMAALGDARRVALMHEERNRGAFAEVAHRIWYDLRAIEKRRALKSEPAR